MLRLLLITFLSTLLCAPLRGQSQPPAPPTTPPAPQTPAVAVDAATLSLKTGDTITVTAEPGSSMMGEPSVRISAQLMLQTAGTMGDPMRYFQALPGVQTGSDQRNDLIIRGGNPSETLFVVDGIEVPSVNQLALSDTTGGLVSMLDDQAIQSMSLHSGPRSAALTDRLSSVIEISTIGAPETKPGLRYIAELGIAGAGGIVSWNTRNHGSFLLSERQSILNLFTHDIGFGGVPIYNNALLQGDRSLGPHDRLWGMSLSGVDSISIRPSASDAHGTNLFNIDYHGWRNTTGANWQHAFNPTTFAVLTASNSEQSQSINQYDPQLSDQLTYTENTHDGATTAKLELTSQAGPWLLSAGGLAAQQRVDYTLAQPIAIPNPYSTNPNSGSTTSLQSTFSDPLLGGFAQATLRLPAAVRLTVATRVTHWGFDAQTSWTPKAFLVVPLGNSRSLGLGYAQYSQLPQFLYLLAFPQNHSLAPIKAQQFTFDLADLVHTHRATLGLSAYDKRYTDYPVAANFPQLSLANIADTFAESFLLFPMLSAGHGRTTGVEATLSMRLGRRLTLQTNATYAREWFTGLDGILRRGNFDIPFSANIGGIWNIRHSLVLSVRYGGSSGRPYTPDIINLSYAQKRDVYNLALINAKRSQTYERLDFRFEQTKPIKRGLLTWYAGLQNTTNHLNFYAYVWRAATGGGIYEVDQMPLFPIAGLHYDF